MTTIKQDETASLQVYASFLLIGQSNMAGRGHFNEVDPISDGRCKMLRMGRWQPMTEPINPDRQILDPNWHSGVSLGATFAVDAANHYGETVGLIPCADGGTRLCEWMPCTLLFDHAVMMCSLARRTSKIRGILWHQGEGDSQSRGEDYEIDLAIMFNELRKALGDDSLPVVIGELGGKILHPTMDLEKVRHFNRRLPFMAERIGSCAVAKAEDLEIQHDGIHFSAQSQRMLGHRYFDAFKTLLK